MYFYILKYKNRYPKNKELEKELKKRLSSSKIIFITIASILISATSYPQTVNGFGIKAGINYNANGDLTTTSNSFRESSRGRVGYHLGLWANKNIGPLPFFIRPEILFTQTRSTYIDFGRSDYDLTKLEVPLLIGAKVLKIGRVFAGPDFQFILDSSFIEYSNGTKYYKNDVETDAFSASILMGIGIDIGKLGLDIRWERGITKGKTTFFDDFLAIDSRANQLICGLTYKLSQ